MIRVPAPSFERIHALMAALRPDITELLFLQWFDGARLERRARDLTEPYATLDRKSDIEALTAAIGLILEAEYQGNEYQHYQAAVIAFRLFLRMATFMPLFYIAPALFEYLNLCFLSSTYEFVPRRGPSSNDINLEAELMARNSVLSSLEDFDVLPGNGTKHRAALYFADVYGLGKAARELFELRYASWKAVKSAHVVRWFVRRLRSVEFTRSCID